MSLNEKIIAITEEVNELMSKENSIGSKEFIKLASQIMNFSDLNNSLERLELEERKEVEYEWIWKEKK